MRSAAVLPLVLAAVAAAPVPADDPHKRDLKAIQGDWVCDYIMNSKVVEKTPGAGVSVRGERLSFTVRGAVLETWAFTLDPTKEPRRIDLRKESDDLRSGDRALRGVYRVEGDSFTLSFGPKDRGRPSDFKGTKDGEDVWVLKRKK